MIISISSDKIYWDIILNLLIWLKETGVNVTFRGYNDTKWKLWHHFAYTTGDTVVITDLYDCISTYHTQNTKWKVDGYSTVHV